MMPLMTGNNRYCTSGSEPERKTKQVEADDDRCIGR